MLASAALALAMAFSCNSADARNNNGNNGNNKPATAQRPGANNPNKPNNNNRPNSSNKPNKPNRPNNSHNSNWNNNPNRPNNSHNSNWNNNPNRPGRPNNHYTPNRPGKVHATAPGTATAHRHNYAPPARPFRPVYSPWYTYRPTRPAYWRPVATVPSISTILGVALGTAISNSIDHLTRSGYIIDGYDNNILYLRDVRQLNLMWPDAALYYDNGRLVGSEYNISTNYYSPARYNEVYNLLCSSYGSPVSTTYPVSGAYLTTWYTPGNGYITLSYLPSGTGGATRYYTTLRVGAY